MELYKTPVIEDTNTLFVKGKNCNYFIGERESGKTTQTIIEAMKRGGLIISNKNIMQARGITHVSSEKDNISYKYATIADLLNAEQYDFPTDDEEVIHVCVDEAREVLAELISLALDAPVVVDFMSMDV